MNHISRRILGLDINLGIVPSRRCRTANGFINQARNAFSRLFTCVQISAGEFEITGLRIIGRLSKLLKDSAASIALFIGS